MMITYEKIGRPILRGEEQLAGPRANTPRGSFTRNSPLPSREFFQSLFNVCGQILGFLFLLSGLLAIPLGIVLMLFF